MAEYILEFPNRQDYGVNEESCGVALFKYLKKHGDKICQIDSITDEKQTFSQLLLKSIRAAQHLETKDLKRDDVITLCAYNTLDSSVPFLAALYLGLKISPIDPLITEDDCLHFLNLVEPKMVFCEPECVDLMKRTLTKIGLQSEIIVFGKTKEYTSFTEYLKPTGKENEFTPKKVDKDDYSLICLSSGTTGLPKGMMLTHRGLLSKYKNPDCFEDPEKVLLYVTSFGWFSAIYMFMLSIFFGHSQILSRQLKGDTMLKITEKYKVNYIFINLFNVYNLINTPNIENYDLSSLNVIVMAGAVLSEEIYTRLKSKLSEGCVIANGYGLTEVCGAATSFIIPDEIMYFFTKPRSVGKGFPGFTLKIVDTETRKPLGPNNQGEICIKTNGIFKGYYNDPKSTATAIDSDGFFMTGDIGYYDEDKCFYIIDRVKDVFRCQGWPISPVELESVLLMHADVNEAAVIGIPHQQDGERPLGIVVLRQGATATVEDVLHFYNDKVSERKKLKEGLIIVDSLPFNINGKLRRKYLRDQFLLGKVNNCSKL